MAVIFRFKCSLIDIPSDVQLSSRCSIDWRLIDGSRCSIVDYNYSVVCFLFLQRGHTHDGENVAENTEDDFNLVVAFAFSGM